MLDLIVRNATLPSGESGQDIAVQDGRIAEVRPKIEATARQEIDAGGHLVTPPFVDSHFHMDSTLSLGLPRLHRSGTRSDERRVGTSWSGRVDSGGRRTLKKKRNHHQYISIKNK